MKSKGMDSRGVRYEYFCQACGYAFEKFRQIGQRDLTSCPECGARVDRKIPVVNHRLTGEHRSARGKQFIGGEIGYTNHYQK